MTLQMSSLVLEIHRRVSSSSSSSSRRRRRLQIICNNASQNQIETHPALKEHSYVVRALQQGSQTVLLRKGGLRDRSDAFNNLETLITTRRSFYLFPTEFHASSSLVKPCYHDNLLDDEHPKNNDINRNNECLVVSSFCRLTGHWQSSSEGSRALVSLLDDFHVWNAETFSRTRLSWNEKRLVSLLELQVFNLDTPLTFPSEDAFYGCFSWIDLPLQQPTSSSNSSTPALNPETFRARQHALREKLRDFQDGLLEDRM